MLLHKAIGDSLSSPLASHRCSRAPCDCDHALSSVTQRCHKSGPGLCWGKPRAAGQGTCPRQGRQLQGTCFGSPPLDVTGMWHDLRHASTKEAQHEEKEKSEKGLKRCVIAHFFLWACPKSINLMMCGEAQVARTQLLAEGRKANWCTVGFE